MERARVAALAEKDFVNVNCDADTWTWKDGVAHCTGEPVGVIRTGKSFTNFELVAQWRHLKSAGNSGIFVWTSDEALKDLKPGTLPRGGIEVQVLDHGYAEQYEKSGQKGRLVHHPRRRVPRRHRQDEAVSAHVAQRRAQLPPKELEPGVGEWNHYYVRCINGEVRLWVNGEEVSGGNELRAAHRLPLPGIRRMPRSNSKSCESASCRS